MVIQDLVMVQIHQMMKLVLRIMNMVILVLKQKLLIMIFMITIYYSIFNKLVLVKNIYQVHHVIHQD